MRGTEQVEVNGGPVCHSFFITRSARVRRLGSQQNRKISAYAKYLSPARFSCEPPAMGVPESPELARGELKYVAKGRFRKWLLNL